jgi:S-formylglutathione hydrolase
MYSYITKELPNILESNFPCLDLKRCSITGHSMGGHGALQIALKNTNLYKSVSAFAPICNPINCPWGIKAFNGYLGENNMKSWEEYDSCSLMKSGISNNHYDDILIDAGLDDNFLTQGQLLPEEFIKACSEVNQKVTVRMQPEYDHSYYFISTFIEDHIDFHAKRLYNK